MPRSSSRAERPRGERALTLGVFAAVLLLDLAWRSRLFNFDGVACAIAVELGDFKHLVHGNHLAYGALGWLFDRAWRLLGWRGRALLPLQVLDSLLGAAGAAVFASLLRRSGRSVREAALGAAALAVSQAWWLWSLEAQVYMLGALFAALAAREALAERPRGAVVGALEAGAVLGHVGHLMALPALAWLVSRRRGRAELKPLAAVLAGTLAAAYLAAGVLAVRPGTWRELSLWLLGSAALGPGRSFGWHSSAPLTAVVAWLSMTLRVFCDFVGRAGFWRAAAVVLALLPLSAAALGARRGGERARFWLLWLAGYAVLYLSWEPGTIVYRVSDLLGLWALALLGLDALAPPLAAAALAAWTAAALAFNLAFTVLPAARPNRVEEDVRWDCARVPPDAWLIADGADEVYVPFFGGRRPLELRYVPNEPLLFARLDALAARGEPVFIDGRMLDQTALRAALTRYGMTLAASEGGRDLYRVARPAGRERNE